MSFKRRGLCFLLSISSLATGLAGCSNYLKGKKQDPEVIELSDQTFACLQDLPTNLKLLAMGNATDAQTRGAFTCMQGALSYFNKRTVGSSSDAYTAEDMRKFFGKYFLKENNVSPELAQQLMRLKKALLGGSDTWITKGEIDSVIDLLGVAQEEVIRITPYIKLILIESHEAAVPWDKVTEATEQLRASLQKLLQGTELSKSDYAFDDFKKLLSGLSDFVNGGQPFPPYVKLSDWMPLAESVKRVLIGDDVALSGLTDWTLALNNLVDLYGVFLRFHYVVAQDNFDNAQDLRQFSQFGKQFFLLIMNSYQMTRTSQIPYTDIDNLVEQLAAKVTLPMGLTAPSIEKTYRIVILNALEPNRGGESRGMYALTRAHMLGIKRELNVWRLSQAFTDTLPYDSHGQIAHADLVTQFDKFNYNYVIQKALDTDPLEQVALAQSWQDFGILMKAPYPVNFNSQGRYVVAENQAQLNQTWYSLSKVNLMRSVTRLLMIGYGDKNSLQMASAALSSQSLSQWYDDFRQIGLEIKAFDPRSTNTGPSSFLEANFFTFSGNGDARMDYKETFEFVSILFSAGLGNGNDVGAGAEKAGCDVSELDVFGYKKMTETCFKDDLHKNFATYFNNLPGVANFVGTLTPAQWEEFYTNLWAASRDSDPTKGLVETSDIRTAVVLLHYIEALFAVYDKNNNQTLSVDEIRAAAPRFLSFLRTVSPGTGDDNLTDAFAYLVIYGAQPTTWQLIKFKTYIRISTPPESTRLNIIKVLGVLKDQLNSPPS